MQEVEKTCVERCESGPRPREQGNIDHAVPMLVILKPSMRAH